MIVSLEAQGTNAYNRYAMCHVDRAEHWRIRRLKESPHMLGYNNLLSRPSIELNTLWEPIIKKARWKKNLFFFVDYY